MTVWGAITCRLCREKAMNLCDICGLFQCYSHNPIILPHLMLQDFHPWDGHRFLSSGMDNCVKVWSLAGKCEETE